MAKRREWRQGDLYIGMYDGMMEASVLKILARHQRNSFDLVFTPYESCGFGFPYIKVLDLTGTQYSSGYQGQGLSSLLVNIGLQVLKSRFPPDSLVEGRVSDVDDQLTPLDLREACHRRRIAFWQSFGFWVVEEEGRSPLITAALSQLSEKREGVVLGRYPRFIPLEQFYEVARFNWWLGLVS